jgi:large subunit ribosomal protein L6
MSRIAKAGIVVPQGIEVKIEPDQITVKGKDGELRVSSNPQVTVGSEGGKITFTPVGDSRQANALSGTMRQLVHNMVIGVNTGFERKLTLVGVGFRAQANTNRDAINLTVGYSHPVDIQMPAGVSVTTPTPTEIILKGADRQRVGQIAAEIRAVRPPEPYKGKGIRYVDEKVIIKETKKK